MTSRDRFEQVKGVLLRLVGLPDVQLELVGLKALNPDQLVEFNAVLRDNSIDPEDVVIRVHQLAPTTEQSIICTSGDFVTVPVAKFVRDKGTIRIEGDCLTLCCYTRATIGNILEAINDLILADRGQVAVTH
jgi:hypothetical protein